MIFLTKHLIVNELQNGPNLLYDCAADQSRNVTGKQLKMWSQVFILSRRYRRDNKGTLNDICLRHETVWLFSMSCDWETVKTVVP